MEGSGEFIQFLSMRAVLLAGVIAAVPPAAGAEPRACGTRPGQERELVVAHRLHASGPRALSTARGDDRDVDDVAVLVDGGDLVIRRNPFDLDRTGVRLTPRGAGFESTPLTVPIEPAGAPLGLGDGEARPVALGFAFPFVGASYREVFVHADGNLTFGAPASIAGEPGVASFAAGPPAIAAFHARFDTTRGGSVTVRTEAARAVVLWSALPGAGQINRNTFQAVLHADGRIDLAWAEMQTRDGLVGVSPGGAAAAAAVDWSAPRAAAEGALVERFADTERLDLVAAVRRFLAGRDDVFQQVIVYTTRPLNPFPGTLAFEINVRNDVRGIGLDVFDHARDWGSAGTLESVVYMDSADTYATVDGFEFLGHEVGHRWLSRLRVAGTDDPLLGRGAVHWSFFMHTEASVMEGNAIADLGNGRFETVDFARRFSPLDQYAMGLRAPAEVPPFFVVEAADDFRPNRAYKASTAPEAGVSFSGVRRDIRIEDVVRAMGPRSPAAGAPVFRQAFVLVADAEGAASEARVATVARIRSRFGPWFHAATGGRGAVLTVLR
jgi:hypothetical protein